MAEETPKPKKKEFDYKLLGHSDKLGILLSLMFELEEALFNHNINMLDENHSEYPSWKETYDEILKELERLRYIFENMGGNWENLQQTNIDEYGEEV